MLVDEFRSRQLPHEVVALPCGHYSTGAAPFKYLDGYVLTKFLRRKLVVRRSLVVRSSGCDRLAED